MSGSTGAVWAVGGGAPPAGRSEQGSGVGTVSDEWPLVSTLELGSLPTAVGCARAHAKLVLAEWGLTPLIEDAATLTSELITNAIQASWTLPDSPPVTLRLLANKHLLVIEAWDQCVESYDLNRQAASDAEHGRGLTVVAALSKQWGVRRASVSFKVVWCELVIGG